MVSTDSNNSIVSEFKLIEMVSNNINFDSNTKKYLDHIIWSYGSKLICVDAQYHKPYKTYFGEDVIEKFLNGVIKEN